jgi:hypothetical protein
MNKSVFWTESWVNILQKPCKIKEAGRDSKIVKSRGYDKQEVL